MLLVAGGQLDPNIGRLLRQVLRRRIAFLDLLVGPDLLPELVLDVSARCLRIGGRDVSPTSAFIRYDVFLQEHVGTDAAANCSLNWFQCLRGWAFANESVTIFNRRSVGSDSNKIQNLFLVASSGLPIPETVISSDPTLVEPSFISDGIQKPVAGGNFTTLASDFLERRATFSKIDLFPRFYQKRLIRPELRVYNIGGELLGFELESPDIDYRIAHRARIRAVEVPSTLQHGLRSLCEQLGLDFAAADFMLDPRSREFVFLEVNTQPMFVAFDDACDGYLVDTILSVLVPTGRAELA